MNMEKLPTDFIVIGVDPGQNAGISRWNPHVEQFIDFRTRDFWETIYFIAQHPPDKTLVICENPKLNAPPMFNAPMPKSPMEAGTQRKRSQSVGMNKSDAYRTVQYLQYHRYYYQAKAPKGLYQRAIGKKGKITMPEFTQITGWTIPLNQNEIDAGLLIYGMSAARVLTICNVLQVDMANGRI